MSHMSPLTGLGKRKNFKAINILAPTELNYWGSFRKHLQSRIKRVMGLSAMASGEDALAVFGPVNRSS